VAKPGTSPQAKSERKPGFTPRGIIKDIQKDPTKDALKESNVIEARKMEVSVAISNDAANPEPKPEQPAKAMAGYDLVKSEARTEEPTQLDRVPTPAGLDLVKSEARTEEPTPLDRVPTQAGPPKPTVSAPTRMEEPKKYDPEPPAKAYPVPLKPKLNDSSEKSWARNVGKKGPVDPTQKASVDPGPKASEKKTSNRPKESPMTSTKPSSKKANGSFLDKLIGQTEQKYGRP
jgi:hypothetical protein